MFWGRTQPKQRNLSGLITAIATVIGVTFPILIAGFSSSGKLIRLETGQDQILTEIKGIKSEIYPRKEAESALIYRDKYIEAKLEALQQKK